MHVDVEIYTIIDIIFFFLNKIFIQNKQKFDINI